jgi:hypothetical protein
VLPEECSHQECRLAVPESQLRSCAVVAAAACLALATSACMQERRPTPEEDLKSMQQASTLDLATRLTVRRVGKTVAVEVSIENLGPNAAAKPKTIVAIEGGVARELPRVCETVASQILVCGYELEANELDPGDAPTPIVLTVDPLANSSKVTVLAFSTFGEPGFAGDTDVTNNTQVVAV